MLVATMPYLFFAAICLVWGTSFILMKKASLAFGPYDIAVWRVAGGAAILAALWAWRRGGAPVPRKYLGPVLLVALVGYAWPFVIQPYLIARAGSGYIGMTVSLVPLLTILVSVPVLGVRPTRRQLLGVLGGLACLVLMLWDAKRRALSPPQMLLAVSVPLSYATTNAYVRRTFRGVSSLGLSLAALSATTAMLAPLALFSPGPAPWTSERFGTAAAALALLGVVCTGLATAMFVRLIQDHGPLFAGMVNYLVPAWAVVWGWVDGERVTGVQLAALVGVLAMVAVVQYRAASPPPVAE